MRKLVSSLSALSLLAGLAVAAAAPAARADKKRATVTVENQSDWEIHHFYVSPANASEWGEDQLGQDVIKPGESFRLSEIPCDSYDVKLVDEDGDECVVEDVDICGGKATWTITSKDLLKCQRKTR